MDGMGSMGARICAAVIVTGCFAVAQAQQQHSATATVHVMVAAGCELDSVVYGAGSVSFTYRMRTSRSGGEGQLRLAVPPEAPPGIVLDWRSPWGSGSSALTPGGEVAVAGFGPNVHTSKSGDRATVTWTLRGEAVALPDVRLVPRITCR